MSTQKPTPKKKSQSPSKKVAKKVPSGSSTKNSASSDTTTKKKPGPKKGSAKKAQPEKKVAAKKAVAKKPVAKKAVANSGDYPRKKAGRPPQNKINPAQFDGKPTLGAQDEINALAKKYKEQIEKGSLRFLEDATTSVNAASSQVDVWASWDDLSVNTSNNTTASIAKAAKKKGLFSRIASWFRPSKRK
jgi:hypothetical protein